MANGYSKGPGVGTGGGGNLGVGREGRPGTTAVLHKKKKKRKTSVRGPEDELMKLTGEGRQMSTRASRYRSGS